MFNVQADLQKVLIFLERPLLEVCLHFFIEIFLNVIKFNFYSLFKDI